MKRIYTILYKFILILIFMFSFSGTVPALAADICFSESNSRQILMELERGRINEKIISEFQSIQGEYEVQIQTLNNNESILKEQLRKDKVLIDNLEQLSKDQDLDCKKMIKEASPSFFEKLGWAGAGAGFMAVVMLLTGL